MSQLEMIKYYVTSEIKYRFAHTVVSSTIVNRASRAQEVSFSVIIPDTAFISGFLMQVDGKVYEAYVKEKEEAKREYDQAVSSGQTAAHVAVSARDSNRFTVSVNVEAYKEVTFNLTYEELLTRRLGIYTQEIYLNPEQIVEDFQVVVNISDAIELTKLFVPEIKTSEEITSEASTANPLAVIERPTLNSAIIKFIPTTQQQKDIASDGIKGKFIVEYDVNRTASPGEVLVEDGYFVHFFAPADLKPLRKQVTFVLDVSGSMSGRKIEQLREAMITILGDLNEGDFFSIVLFASTVQVWDYALTDYEVEQRLLQLNGYQYGVEQIDEHSQINSQFVVATATPENISKAKAFIQKLTSTSSTNIHGALMTALDITNKYSSNFYKTFSTNEDYKPEPIIIFLTDGQPNVGISIPDEIVSSVTSANVGRFSIFTLALGSDADFNFLKKLSLKNEGFARKIYEASDTALQLRDFYLELASPVIDNVTFTYTPGEVNENTLTRRVFRRLFDGSELVVAGQLLSNNFTGKVEGRTTNGLTVYPFYPICWEPPIIRPMIDNVFDPYYHRICPPYPIPLPPIPDPKPSHMEKLWAYLTIQQLLEEYEASDDGNTSPEKQRALDLALKYSFVTPLTSLVVVKPNEVSAVDAEDASSSNNPFYGGYSGGAVFPGFVDKLQAVYAPGVFTTTGLSFIYNLGRLEDVTWLPANGDSVTLPVGTNGEQKVLKVASASTINEVKSACITPLHEPGHCRHLRYCVLDAFETDESKFIPYYCPIDDYVGVCCPDYI